MVYGIIKNHGGHITCESAPDIGTTFRIYFPTIADSELQMTEQGDQRRSPATGQETILLVDDEEYLRDLGQLMLNRFGYTVLTAPDGETALEIYREHKNRIALVILDLIMPGIGGQNCLGQILALDPSAKVVIASGYSVDDSAQAELQSKAKGFIKKPFEFNQILEEVRRLLDEK